MKERVKIPLEEISLVCWVILISSGQTLVEATMIAMNQPTECTVSGQVPIPTTAYPTKEEDFMTYPDSAQTYRTGSRIICASYSLLKKAVALSYEDGVCTIYGAGNGLYNKVSYYGAHLMPPAEDIEDVSRFKPAYSSQPLSEAYIARVAVNGNYENSDRYESITDFAQPWWMVDLTEARLIYQVHIFTRQECCYERLHDLEIRIGQELISNGDLSSYTLMSTYAGPYNVTQGHVICSSLRGIGGRFLAIKKVSIDVDPLQLVEVRVYAAKKK
ncbi:uncharacterized protein [Palaemon carinicauda]|uniref:uncharacterized protein n=1 Tax=Palaemon carinicauda TaxID=392227 RepID=UPI0035B6AAD6